MSKWWKWVEMEEVLKDGKGNVRAEGRGETRRGRGWG